MQILYMLERLRTPGLNELMLAVTHLGDEITFLVIALIMFWCVDKRRGYFLIFVGFVGAIIVQFLKLACLVPRPWVTNPNFTILEAAREGAAGYSFPSGHSQAAVGVFGALAWTSKKKWVQRLCIAVMILVPFSRMYLGVHTLNDVVVGSCISLALIWLLYPPVMNKSRKSKKLLIVMMLILAADNLLYVEFWPFPPDVDPANLAHGRQSAFSLLGATLGMAVAYHAERKHVNFSTEAPWWGQILKVVLGLGLLLVVKEVLCAPLETILPVVAARMLEYFLVVLTAGLLWPFCFQYAKQLGEKVKQK